MESPEVVKARGRSCSGKSSAVHFVLLGESFFVYQMFFDKCSFGFPVQGVVSSGVMFLGYKPIAKSLASRTPSIDPPCLKDQEPFSLPCSARVCVGVCGLPYASGRAICCTSFC